jgi:hypothetical protein
MDALSDVERLSHTETSHPLQALLEDALEDSRSGMERALLLASWTVLAVELRLRPFFLSLHHCLEILTGPQECSLGDTHSAIFDRYFSEDEAPEYYGNQVRKNAAVVSVGRARWRFERALRDLNDDELAESVVAELQNFVARSRHDPTPPEDREVGEQYQHDKTSIRNDIAHGNLGLQDDGDLLLSTSRLYEAYLTSPPGEDASTRISRMPVEELEQEARDLAHYDSLAKGWEQILCTLDTWLTTSVLDEPYPPGSSPTQTFTSTMGFLRESGGG